MKKLINSPKSLVNEMCMGMEKAFPNIVKYDEKNVVISRKESDDTKVNLISGGGSGHEPAHGGFVGKGMLDAAVCGDVFASPSVMQVYNAILKNHSDKGVLLIIKNYSGDVMNFESAAEMAEEDDINIKTVCVNDDVAIKDKNERRGVAGTLYVHKIAGAAAESGSDLKEVKRIAEKVIENVRTMGVALKSCTVPARGKSTFDLEDDKIEMGVGIHGEAGTYRDDFINAKGIVEKLMKNILCDLPYSSEDEVAVMINGFGGTPLQELFIINNEVREILKKKRIEVFKTEVGNFMTSIDMEGISITLLKLDNELKKLLVAPANTAAWKQL